MTPEGDNITFILPELIPIHLHTPKSKSESYKIKKLFNEKITRYLDVMSYYEKKKSLIKNNFKYIFTFKYLYIVIFF